MKAFEVNTSRCSYLVIAGGFGEVVELLHQKGIQDKDIVSVQQMEDYKGNYILIEERLITRNELREEVRRELQKGMPQWKRMHNGAAGGSDHPHFLVRSSKGHYYASTCITSGDVYLDLEELEHLPGLPME